MPALSPGLPCGTADLWHFPGQLWAPGPQTWDSTEDRQCSQTRYEGNGWDWALLDTKQRVTPGCLGDMVA